MRKPIWTVGSLASAADLDVEQVLVALWSEGIDYPVERSDRIRQEDVAQAERAAGLGFTRATRVSYWLRELDISRVEFGELLDSLGVRLPDRAQTLPKGALRRLRAHFGLSGTLSPQTPKAAEAVSLPAAPPFQWEATGARRDCDLLSAEDILKVHEALTEDFELSADPISPPGVKSRDLLESAASRPATSFGDSRKYTTVESAASSLLHSVVHNHPFHNGNKRTALVATMVFLDRHNLVIESTQDDLFRFMVRVAAHSLLPEGFTYDQLADREVAAISTWVTGVTRQIRREERAVTWRELQRKLKARGCSIAQERGGKFEITREVPGRRRFLGGHRVERLETHFLNAGDGREVPKAILKRIRQELQLDADHGVDAEVFYGDHKEPDFFILQYSQLLKRLARV